MTEGARALRLGLVGLGNWGNKLAQVAAELDGVELAMCYARSSERRVAFAAQHGCEPAASLDEMTAADLDITVTSFAL